MVSGLPVGTVLACETLPPFPQREGTPVSCCASSGGRYCDNVEARHLGCAQGHQSVTERACLAGKGLDLAFAVLALIGLDPLLDIGAAMF